MKISISFLCCYLLFVFALCVNAQETDIKGKLYNIHTKGVQVDESLKKDSELLFSISNEELINGNNEKAIDYLTQLIKTNPSFAQAYCNRGIAYRGIKNYPKALMDFNTAIKINPKLEEAYLSRGLLFALTNDLTKALDDFNHAIQIDKNSSQAYLNRGLIYKLQQKYDSALWNYNEAIKINPEFIEAYQNRFILNASFGNNEAALNDCNKMIELNPNDGYAYYLRATLYYVNCKDQERACKDWYRSIELGYEKASDEYGKYCR